MDTIRRSSVVDIAAGLYIRVNNLSALITRQPDDVDSYFFCFTLIVIFESAQLGLLVASPLVML